MSEHRAQTHFAGPIDGGDVEGERPGFDPAYLVTLDEIYHARWMARKRYRIDLLKEAVASFWPAGHPTRLVHLAGTNGKGSVAHYLEQGLRFAGPTGSWTGPHVFDYAERFHLSGAQVERREIVEVYRRLLLPYQRALGRAHGGEALGFAELGILLALHLFDRHGARWGLLETGAGGRYTPLMALPVAACVVTDVGFDHPRSLGTELWQRALEKAGIARPGVPLFTAARGEARELVRAAAESEGADVHVVNEEDLAEVVGVVGPETPRHERSNLALALALIRHFHPEKTAADLVPAMRRRLPGRFVAPEPGVIVDVAHNADKVRALAERLRLAHPGREFRFLVGLTRSRDPVEVFAPLLEIATHVTVTGASYAGQEPRRLGRRLARVFPHVSVEPDPRRAYRRERQRLGEGEILVLTGSAYLIDQALNPDPYVRHLNAAYGWRGGGDASGGGRDDDAGAG